MATKKKAAKKPATKKKTATKKKSAVKKKAAPKKKAAAKKKTAKSNAGTKKLIQITTKAKTLYKKGTAGIKWPTAIKRAAKLVK